MNFIWSKFGYESEQTFFLSNKIPVSPISWLNLWTVFIENNSFAMLQTFFPITLILVSIWKLECSFSVLPTMLVFSLIVRAILPSKNPMPIHFTIFPFPIIDAIIWESNFSYAMRAESSLVNLPYIHSSIWISDDIIFFFFVNFNNNIALIIFTAYQIIEYSFFSVSSNGELAFMHFRIFPVSIKIIPLFVIFQLPVTCRPWIFDISFILILSLIVDNLPPSIGFPIELSFIIDILFASAIVEGSNSSGLAMI